MKKTDFIALYAVNAGIPNNEAKKYINLFLDTIETAATQVTVTHKETPTFRKKIGLGDLKIVVQKKAARQGRNPKTGIICDIPARIKLSAIFGKRFKDFLTSTQAPTTNTKEKQEKEIA